jgi:hypothetical protein
MGKISIQKIPLLVLVQGATISTTILVAGPDSPKPAVAMNELPAAHMSEGAPFDPEYNLVCVSRVRDGAKPAEASSSLTGHAIHWENLAYGYNAYQDGGYWYYMSLGVAVALNRKHPELAREWGGNAYDDMARADANPPYERIDGMKPVNNRYNASVGPLMGMGRPATVSTVNVLVRK